jgi:dinuclear metal center YbgI/SA1388 family protein
MATVALSKITAYTDRLLRTGKIEDWPGAANGLQVENNGKITRLAAAVDASGTVLQMAVAAQADLLIVHHGLFWSPSHPWTGKRYTQVKTLLDHNLAVYSSHLPLDVHPVHGNNVQLCRALNLKPGLPFFHYKNQLLGVSVHNRISRQELTRRLQLATGQKSLVAPFGPQTCRKIGIVTGGAGDQIRLAASEGIDTLITGEGPHWSFTVAEELEVNILYAGHYATETFGVKSLAQHLAHKFNLPWIFLDNPTGL